MPRPSRTWIRKTYTVSPEVTKATAARAAEQDIDPGTVMDIIVWNAILKPDAARLKRGGLTEKELERIFAEEVLGLIRDDHAIEVLAEEIILNDEDAAANLRIVLSLLRRWRKIRQIDPEHREGALHLMGRFGQAPSILEHGCVDLGWFQPK